MYELVTTLCACAVWLFGLTPPLDQTLHWPAMLPLSGDKALGLVLWTLPLAGVYTALGLLRRTHQQQAAAGGGLPQSAAIVATHLQRSQRTVRHHLGMSRDDLRATFFLATVVKCSTTGVWLFGVLPGVVTKVASAIAVRLPALLTRAHTNLTLISSFSLHRPRAVSRRPLRAQGPLAQDPSGALLRNIVYTPLLAVTVAAVTGAADYVGAKAADSFDRDEARDETVVLDSLFNVATAQNTGDGAGESAVRVADGKITVLTNLGSDPKRWQTAGAAAPLQRALSAAKQAPDAVPSRVTLDLASAMRKVRASRLAVSALQRRRSVRGA